MTGVQTCALPICFPVTIGVYRDCGGGSLGGVCGAAEWAVPVGPASLSVLSRDRGAAAVDARGGVVERAEVSERHIGEYLRRHPLSRGRGADGE